MANNGAAERHRKNMSNPQLPFSVPAGTKSEEEERQNNLNYKLKTNNLSQTHNGGQTKHVDRDKSRAGKPVAIWVFEEGADGAGT
jgi:hypothetical protein